MEENSNIFDPLLKGRQIFCNREVLRASYNPSRLPHRDGEINHLATILVDALRGETPSNVFIYGQTGTGKTAVVNFVGKELRRKAAEITRANMDRIMELTLESLASCDGDAGVSGGELSELISSGYERCGFTHFFGEEMRDALRTPVHFIYINCQHVDTQYRILTHVANHFVSSWGELLPKTGWPTDEVYNRLRENIDRAGGVTTIILDEVDRLVLKSGDDVLYSLSRINSDLSLARASVIGISNDTKFTELLDPRVKSSLGEEELVFHPYNAEQLQDILEERAGKAFYSGTLGEGVVALCAGLAAQEHGDARRALDLLRVSAEIAEREASTVLDQTFVGKAQKRLELDRVAEVVRTLPSQSKVVLFGILLEAEAGKSRITTGDAFEAYLMLCRELDVAPLTSRRVTDLISELDMLGIISASVKSFGRGGRTRIIQMGVPLASIRNVLEEGGFLQPVWDISLPTGQTRLALN